MNCKQCGAPLEDGQQTCPFCGAIHQNDVPEAPEMDPSDLSREEEICAAAEDSLRDGNGDFCQDAVNDLDPQPSAPRRSGRSRIIAIVAVILVVALLGAGAVYLVNRKSTPKDVIAQVGEHSLDNQSFMYYYWAQFYYLYNTYGSSLSYYLDLDTPFEDQEYDDEQTWADYFSKYALDSWAHTMILCDAGKAEGFALSEEDEANLKEIETDLSTDATENKYESVEDYLQHAFDLSADVESYLAYSRESYYASAYVNYKYKQMLEEAKTDHSATEGIHCVNVRHILIKPATSGDEASLAEAKAKAEEIYAEWKKDPTSDHFAALAKEYSEDTGSSTDGGLYEDVEPGQMVEAFNDWCFAEGRAAADHGIVKTDHGYHIMYLESISDKLYQSEAEAAAEEVYDAWLSDLLDDVSYDSFLDHIVFQHAEAETADK